MMAAVFVILDGVFFKFLDKDALTERANHLLQKEDQNALEQLQQIMEELDEHDTHLEIKSATVYLCFRNDSMLMWSNNHEPIPYFLSDYANINQPVFELANGFFHPVSYRKGAYTLVALIPIYYQYPAENNYFRNGFSPLLQLPENAGYSCGSGLPALCSADGEFLCSISYPQKIYFTGWRYKVCFIIFLLCYLGVFFCLLQTYRLSLKIERKPMVFWLYIGLMIVIMLSVLWIRYPSTVFNHPLFSSKYFAYNWFFSSLGEVFFLGLAIVPISFAMFEHLTYWRIRPKKNLWFFNALFPVLSGMLFYLLGGIHEIFVLNTTVFLDLSFIFNIDQHSVILLLALSCFSIAVFLANLMLVRLLAIKDKRQLLALLAEIVLVAVLLMFFHKARGFYFMLTVLWIMVPVFIFYYGRKVQGRYLLYLTLLLGFISVSVLQYFVGVSEKEHRLYLAEEFSRQGRQEDKELLFDDLVKQIMNDEVVRKYILNFNDTVLLNYDKVVCDYIVRYYMYKNWHGYDIAMYVCTEQDVFDVTYTGCRQSCFDYFQEQIDVYGQPAFSKYLWLLKDQYYSSTYIGVIDVQEFYKKSHGMRFFIEMHPVHPHRESGYPEFLMEKSALSTMDASRYSYAFYDHNELSYSFGNVTFPQNMAPGIPWDTTMQSVFYNIDNLNNLRYRMPGEKVIVISKTKKNIPQILSPYIYLMVTYQILIYLTCLFVHAGFIFTPYSKIRAKLQRAILLVLSLAFMLIGVAIVFFMGFLNENKERENLYQKTQSILSIINHSTYVGDAIFLESGMGNIKETAIDLSRIFYSDINIYWPSGLLAGASSPNIFEQGMLSKLMNYEAYCKIAHQGEHLVIQEEYVGNKRYLSSYSAMYNGKGELSSILNVTYFSHAGKYENDMASFISTFLNIYILVFLLFVVTLLYLSNQITLPVRLLTQYFGKIRIGRENEKIRWDSEDEFSRLIEEYNQMVDDLEASARKLADSERESGWRDMAQQVAHEIKNPLTPMKLNVQHFQRTWKDGTPYTKEQIDRFSNTLIQQIDALSDIADAFSNFARVPKSHRQPIGLSDVVEAAIGVYDGAGIAFHVSGFEHLTMDADPGLMLRVFNNLIKNAVQSFEKGSDNQIWIMAHKAGHLLTITVRDNGNGISKEMVPRIFIPTFTTRSTGMGLGLPMVKTIVEEHNGTISVASEEKVGTIFTMVFETGLPL